MEIETVTYKTFKIPESIEADQDTYDHCIAAFTVECEGITCGECILSAKNINDFFKQVRKNDEATT